VEIELLGIPAHAWDLSTSEQLLNDYCWISGVHPATADCRDCFRVATWCSDPVLIPPELVLEIVEPTPAAGSSDQEKRTLCYPISISVSAFDQPASPGNPPSPGPADDDHQGCRRRQRRSPSPAPPARRALSSPPANPGACASVHARLGPHPVAACHVVMAQRRRDRSVPAGHRQPVATDSRSPAVNSAEARSPLHLNRGAPPVFLELKLLQEAWCPWSPLQYMIS
jgi:hypothetical protein